MKKLALTFAIVLGLSMTTFADGGGLFQRGNDVNNNGWHNRDITMPSLPGEHGLPGNQDANGPVGTGIAVLTVLGAAYLVGKRRKED